MAKFDADAVARFEEILRRDAHSQVFAPLADAYREIGRLPEAEILGREGVKKHPRFPGGWLAYGKALRDGGKHEEAFKAFRQAAELSPENLLALQLMGESLLTLKQSKEALKVFKKILFLNPLAEKAKRIVGKLETLTADEYDQDVFAMTRLRPLSDAAVTAAPPPAPASPAAPAKGLTRMLSLVDAFIVRNEISRADQLLDETQTEFGEHAEIQQRRQMLQRRRASQLAEMQEQAEPLAPLSSREEMIVRKKVEVLRLMLREIERAREASLPS